MKPKKSKWLWGYLEPKRGTAQDYIQYTSKRMIKENLIRIKRNKIFAVSTNTAKNFLKLFLSNGKSFYLHSSMQQFLKKYGTRYVAINKSESVNMNKVKARLQYRFLFIKDKIFKVTFTDKIKSWFEA